MQFTSPVLQYTLCFIDGYLPIHPGNPYLLFAFLTIQRKKHQRRILFDFCARVRSASRTFYCLKLSISFSHHSSLYKPLCQYAAIEIPVFFCILDRIAKNEVMLYQKMLRYAPFMNTQESPLHRKALSLHSLLVLQRIKATLAGTNLDHIRHIIDKDLAITDMPGIQRLSRSFYNFFNRNGRYNDLKLNLRK